MATTGNVSSAPQIDDTMIDVDTTSTNNDGLNGSLVYPQDAMAFPFMQIILKNLQPAKLEGSTTVVSSASSNLVKELPSGIRNAASAGLAKVESAIPVLGGLIGINLGGIGDLIRDWGASDFLKFIGLTDSWVDAGKVFPDFGQDTDTKSVNLLTRFANGTPAKIRNILSKPTGSIVLPMPTSFSDGASGGWSTHNMSLGATAADKVYETFNKSSGDLSSTIKTLTDDTSQFMSSVTKEQAMTAGALMISKGIGMGDDFSVITKSLINPRMTMKFGGRDIRTFSFEYVLAPRNEKEVKAVMAILLQLKLASYPSLSDSAGLTLKYPTELEIHFFDSNGNPYQGLNRALPKILPCVITDLGIQYSSNQNRWAVLGGSEIKFPTHTKLTFTVSETEVLHTGQIQMEGY